MGRYKANLSPPWYPPTSIGHMPGLWGGKMGCLMCRRHHPDPALEPPYQYRAYVRIGEVKMGSQERSAGLREKNNWEGVKEKTKSGAASSPDRVQCLPGVSTRCLARPRVVQTDYWKIKIKN